MIRQVVEAAGGGIFTQPGDPSALAELICTLAADGRQCPPDGLAGRRYLEEHFSRAAIAEKLTGILEEMAR